MKSRSWVFNKFINRGEKAMENSTRVQNLTDGALASSKTLLAIQLICYSGIIFVGTFGNVLIFLSIVHKKKRIISDYFIVNLTITDLLCCVVSIPFDIMELTVGLWPLGLVMCKLVYPLQTILSAVSVGTLLFMALERHRTIMNPLLPKLRAKYALFTIILLWLTAVILVSPYMAVLQMEDSQCTEHWGSDVHVKVFTVCVFVVLYVSPLSVIIAAYIRVGIKLKKGNRSINRDFGSTMIGRRMCENRSKRNVHVVKIFACAVLAFAGCLLPFHIMWLWYDFGDAEQYRHFNDLLTFANILAYSNSAINPFIFGALSRKCRGWFCFCNKRNTRAHSEGTGQGVSIRGALEICFGLKNNSLRIQREDVFSNEKTSIGRETNRVDICRQSLLLVSTV